MSDDDEVFDADERQDQRRAASVPEAKDPRSSAAGAGGNAEVKTADLQNFFNNLLQRGDKKTAWGQKYSVGTRRRRMFSKSVSDSELVAFARKENSSVKVAIVNGCSEVTAEGVQAIAKECTELQEFQAEKVQKAGAAAFAELITLRSGTLVLLNLSGCSLGAEGAQLIGSALRSR
jgi:hypothetical protein